MRVDTQAFAEKNLARSKRPRFVVEMAFDAANTVLKYFTSHADAALPPGAAFVGNVLKDLSGTSQQLNPDKANATIGKINFKLVDRARVVTQTLGDQLQLGRTNRLQRVRVFMGFEGIAWADYALLPMTQLVTEVSYHQGAYSFECNDIQREMRKRLFPKLETTLTQSLTKEETTVTVDSTDGFEPVEHGVSFSDAPGQTVYYFVIDDGNETEREIVRATDKTSTTFTGCTRGALNTQAVAHAVDLSVSVDRRTKVTEYRYLEMPALKLMYAHLNGRILGTDNLLLRSEEFDNASWSKTNITVTADNTTAPNGTATMEKLAATASAATTAKQAATVNATKATFSVYIKKGSGATDGNRYLLRNATTATDLLLVTINFDTRVITYITGSSGAVLVEDRNGCMRLFLTATSGISSGNSIEGYAAFTGAAETAGEYSFAWGGQINATDELLPYAKTTTAARAQAMLPTKWHLGIPAQYVRMADFLNKPDLYDVLDDDAGVVAKFEGLEEQRNGKQFIEEQLALLAGVFMPVYSDGELGCRRMANILAGAAYSQHLSPSNLVGPGDPLDYDYKGVHNVFDVAWSWEPKPIDDYTRHHVLVDDASFALWKEGEPFRVQFRGLAGSRQVTQLLGQRFDAMRDRYSGPPFRTRRDVLPSLNTIEIADVVRLQDPHVRDFFDATQTLDRSFEVQGASVNWIRGAVSLNLFGSSAAPGAIAPTQDTVILPQAWYEGDGTALTSVLTIGAGHITANGSLTGNADAHQAIYYYIGDLTLDADKIVNWPQNIWLRVMGHLTINGTFDAKSAGHAGATATGTPTSVSDVNLGTQGFLGATAAGGGFKVVVGAGFVATRAAPLLGLNSVVPHFQLLWDGTTLYGVPNDLRGTSGSSGMPVFSEIGYLAAGGAGGAGGGGLMITCRGLSFGAAGKIDISGGDGSIGSFVDTDPVIPQFNRRYYAGSGAGGAPGGLFIMLDGALTTATGLTDAKFIAKNGKTPIAGEPIAQSTPFDPVGNYTSIYVGTGDGTTFPLQSLSGARGGARVQFVPKDMVAEEDPSAPDLELLLQELQASNWTLRTTAKTFELKDVIRVERLGLFVAVGTADGTDAYILTSPDGVTWTERANPKNFDLNGIADDGTTLVAVGGADGADAYIITSTDAVTWTERANPKNVALNSVIWVKWLGLFIACGAADGTDAYLITSPDGITWTERANPKNVNLQKLAASNSEVVAVGANDGSDLYVVSSVDALSWTERITPNAAVNLDEVVWTNKRYVAVGGATGTGAYIITSDDGGVTWQQQTNPQNGSLWALVTTQRIVVAAGNIGSVPYVILSRDGKTWRNIEGIGGANTMRCAAWSGTRFVMAGIAGNVLTSMAR